MTIPRTESRSPVKRRWVYQRSDFLRERAARVAREALPRAAKVYELAGSRKVYAARKDGGAIGDVLCMLMDASPEGAQMLAALFQTVADERCGFETPDLTELRRRGVETNHADTEALFDLDPDCPESVGAAISAIKADIATDRVMVLALSRYV